MGRVEDVWTKRDLLVLEALVRHFDSGGGHAMGGSFEVEGLSREEIRLGLAALGRAVTDPYIDFRGTSEARVAIVMGVTERAYRAVSAWPTAESVVQRLIEELDAAAESESDPEKKSRLKETARFLGGTAYNIALSVAGC